MCPGQGGATILFLVTEDWYFVSHRLALACAARAEGYRVVVATRVRSHGDVIRAAGLELVPLGWRRSGNGPRDHWRALHDLVRLYRDVRPDLVHHVALKPVIFGSYAARKAGVPRVVNALAGLGFAYTSRTTRARVLRPVLTALLRASLRGERRLVIVQNAEDRATLIARSLAPADRVHLIRGSGVDLSKFALPGVAEAPPVVVFASRMLWDKGVGTFVEAAESLRQDGVGARFVLVGDPDPDNPSSVPRARLEAWHAEGAVEWWGYRPDMPEVMRQAAIFCLPTRYGEGIPKVLLEAGASGLALVVSDVAGCREVVRDGRTGVIVPPGNAELLAKAIRELLGDPVRRRTLGEAARRLIGEEFSLDVVIRQTLELYRGLLAR